MKNARLSIAVAAGLVVALGASTAVAQRLDQTEEFQSPITGGVELRFGNYTPDIDSEFAGAGPVETYFEGSLGLYLEAVYDYYLYDDIGTFGLGFHLGYTQKSGSALLDDGSESADLTRLRLVPLRVSARYRFDYLQDRWQIPFVIALEAGLDYYFWRVGGEDGVAQTGDFTGRGGTTGFHYGIGFHFLLDFLAPNMARAFDANTGVNSSYIFAHYLVAQMDDFGGANSWNLSDKTLLFGLAFEF